MTLICYTLFIILLLWVFQVLYLNSYYRTMRQKVIISVGNEIAEAAQNANFEKNIERICFQNQQTNLQVH